MRDKLKLVSYLWYYQIELNLSYNLIISNVFNKMFPFFKGKKHLKILNLGTVEKEKKTLEAFSKTTV